MEAQKRRDLEASQTLDPVLVGLRKRKQEKFGLAVALNFMCPLWICSPSELRMSVHLWRAEVALASFHSLIILTARKIIIEAPICALFQTCKQDA